MPGFNFLRQNIDFSMQNELRVNKTLKNTQFSDRGLAPNRSKIRPWFLKIRPWFLEAQVGALGIHPQPLKFKPHRKTPRFYVVFNTQQLEAFCGLKRIA